MSALITLHNIAKVFYTDEIETHALTGISLNIHEGEYVSISGSSGCGKSTLLAILGLLDEATSGEYQLNGHQVLSLNNNERAQIRNKEVGFIFQSFNLISDLTVAENVALPLTYRKDLSKKDIKQAVKASLAKVNLANRSNHYPSQLSGGQQQRVAVARAIAGEPAIILADEPTGNLDSKNAESVMALLDELHQGGATICMVTHDPRSAQRAERQIDIFDGKIVSDQKIKRNSAAA